MTAEILLPTPGNILRAAQELRSGHVVGMPTETVYGLAGCVFDETALTRIFETKERPTFDPLIVHVSLELGSPLSILSKMGLVDLDRLSPLARERVEKAIAGFWPGPLTLVLPKQSRVPDLVTSGLANVGVRMPRHPVARALIEAAGMPLAAPSANRFGRISPTSAQDVATELGDRISTILDGGTCEVGLESTVLLVTESGELKLLRPGGIPTSEIEQVTGASVFQAPGQSRGQSPGQAPGMLDSHYAPTKPLYLLPKLPTELPEILGLLILSGNPDLAAEKLSKTTGRRVIARTLSAGGDLAEAGRNLFSTLRFLDQSPAQVLLAEPCHDTRGLGHAIGDRLRRASAKR